MRKLMVYVAGKYTDDTDEKVQANIDVADAEARALFKLGFIPVIPHKNSAFWDKKDPDLANFEADEWLEEYCFPLQQRCDLTYLSPNWKRSPGAIAEHKHAHELRQPHAESTTELCVIRCYLNASQYKEAREMHNEIN